MAERPLGQRGPGQVSPCCWPWVLHLYHEEMALVLLQVLSALTGLTLCV